MERDLNSGPESWAGLTDLSWHDRFVALTQVEPSLELFPYGAHVDLALLEDLVLFEEEDSYNGSDDDDHHHLEDSDYSDSDAEDDDRQDDGILTTTDSDDCKDKSIVAEPGPFSVGSGVWLWF